MKNKLWILIAVIVVILAGVGVYFLQGPGGSLSTIGNTSMRSLLASGASQKCTFSNQNSNGTIYVGGGKMRGDFSSKTDDTTAQSHMVITNNIAYVWIDGMAQGYRMPFEDLSAQGGSVGGIDADAKVATKCESWQASDVSFTLPTDVTFNAVGAAPSGGSTTPTNATTSSSSGASAGATINAGAGADAQTYAEKQCTACNMITDSTQKAQCKASFDCR